MVKTGPFLNTPGPDPRHCAVCRYGAIENVEMISCPSCGIPVHQDCWVCSEGRCPVYGCAPQAPQPIWIGEPDVVIRHVERRSAWTRAASSTFEVIQITTLAVILSWVIPGIIMALIHLVRDL